MAVEQQSEQGSRESVRVALKAMVAMGIAVVILAATQGGPAFFLQLGDKQPALPHAIEVLGDDVPKPFDDGHDGAFFWELARDPLLTDADTLNEYLDRPLLRAQRIGYPALAAPWYLFGEDALLWGLVVTNVLAMGAGTYFMSRWAVDLGRPPALGYVFLMSPLVWIALLFDLGGVVAMAGLVGAIWLFRRGDMTGAVIATVVTVLARDAMIIGFIGVALFAKGPSLRDRILLTVPAGVAGLAWRFYADLRLGDVKESEIVEFTLVPFGDLIEAWDRWAIKSAWGQAIAVTIIVAFGVFTVLLWLRDRHALTLAAAAPFGALGPVFTTAVLSLWHNVIRGVGPAVPLVLFYFLTREREPAPDPESAAVP